MTVERAIHFSMFVLLLIGFCFVSAWASFTQLGDPVLAVAGLALSWGLILSTLYLLFKQLSWDWWS